MSLEDFGWDEAFALEYIPRDVAGQEPARVVCELRRNFYAVQTADDELLAECGGGFFHHARVANDFPAIGDWVVVRRRPGEPRADIIAVLPRRTKFSRRAAGSEAIEQIVAANVDTIFLVGGLDRNFNPQRLQRFLVAARESGAQPAILLNKADVATEPERLRDEVAAAAPGLEVYLTSSVTRLGLRQLASRYMKRGRTVAFIGSSGVGKSSLINALLRDEAMPTAEVRAKDSKGRHTTTRRELVATPGGALLIDTPGLRELQFWRVDDGVDQAFPDIQALAVKCRFTDCRHGNEPGCAVRAAVAAGELSAERFHNYEKLRAEQALRPSREKKPAALAHRPGWKNRTQGDQPFRFRQHRDE